MRHVCVYFYHVHLYIEFHKNNKKISEAFAILHIDNDDEWSGNGLECKRKLGPDGKEMDV